MSTAPFDAVLCDLDGVLRLWPRTEHIEVEHRLPVGSIAAAAFAAERLAPAITGRITDERWRADVAADLAIACGDARRASAAVAAWSQLTPEVDQQVLSLLTEARGRVPLALVSNATTRLENDLRDQGLLEIADAIVSSSRVGVAKPDERIYQIAAARLGARPDRCLFIDDTAVNVDTARALGMTAVLYRDPRQLAIVLAPLLA